MVYLASDVPLPLVAWNENRPDFNVAELLPEADAVRKQFSKPNVYYVGSWQHCGCGFKPIGHDAARQSREKLGDYIREALSHQGIVELHTCWAHDEESPAERHFQYTVEELLTEAQFPDERDHYLVRLGKGSTEPGS